MKLKYKWICGLLAAGLLSTTMTACGYPWSYFGTEKRDTEPGVGTMTPQTEARQAEKRTKENGTETEETAGTDGGKDRKDGAGGDGETEEDGGAEDPEEAYPLPERFDYREGGRLPRVGSQGDLGTCWAFATMLALESSLLPEELWDFSEDHISLKNSFGMDQDMGGDYTMAMAYLLAWQGPVREEDDPYGDGVSPEGLKAVKHVQEIRIPGEKDYDAVKRAVYFHGGVQTSLYMELENGEKSEYYNEETFAYYYDGTEISNHDIVIVGWDDHYSKENFTYGPKKDGAFLCVNSWGSQFGDRGLFYVSYEDVNVGRHNLVYTQVEEPDNYDVIYQSDLCGWLGQLGYGEESAYFANVYRAEGNETLEAVGFYATDEDTEYEVYVAEEDGEPGRLVLGEPAAGGRLRKKGFYTVKLGEPAVLEAGKRFAVAVFVRTPGAVHPVAVEYQNRGNGEAMAQVDLSDGEGYISADGRLWTRAETEQDSNICLKAYTRKR